MTYTKSIQQLISRYKQIKKMSCRFNASLHLQYICVPICNTCPELSGISDDAQRAILVTQG